MNSDFEKQLQRQPMKQIPADWRAEILRNAQAASPAPASKAGWLAILKAQLASILWPCPQAWAGLAAIWILIFAVNFSSDGHSQTSNVVVAQRPEQFRTVLLERRRELSQLLDSFTPAVVSPVPRPQSERRREVAVA